MWKENSPPNELGLEGHWDSEEGQTCLSYVLVEEGLGDQCQNLDEAGGHGNAGQGRLENELGRVWEAKKVTDAIIEVEGKAFLSEVLLARYAKKVAHRRHDWYAVDSGESSSSGSSSGCEYEFGVVDQDDSRGEDAASPQSFSGGRVLHSSLQALIWN